MLQMYELCYDYKNYQGAKDKLLEFQKYLLNVRGKKILFFSIALYFWVSAHFISSLDLSSEYVNLFPCQAFSST